MAVFPPNVAVFMKRHPRKAKKSLASVNKPIFQRAKEQDPAGTFAQNL